MSLLCSYVQGGSISLFLVVLLIYVIVDFLFKSDFSTLQLLHKKRIIRWISIVFVTIVHAYIITTHEDECELKWIKKIIQDTKHDMNQS